MRNSDKINIKAKGTMRVIHKEVRPWTILTSAQALKKKQAEAKAKAKPRLHSDKIRKTGSGNGNSATSDDADYGGGSNQSTPTQRRRTIRTTWSKYSINTLVRWYVSALGMGEPKLHLMDPKPLDTSCQCPKRKKTVTLYMLCGKIAAIYYRFRCLKLFCSPCQQGNHILQLYSIGENSLQNAVFT